MGGVSSVQFCFGLLDFFNFAKPLTPSCVLFQTGFNRFSGGRPVGILWSYVLS